MGAGSLQSQSFSAAGGSGGGGGAVKSKSRSFFSRLSRFRRVPSLFHIWLIVLCSTLSLTLAGVLVQDVEVGFFNSGNQCLKEGDSALPSCKKAQQKVQNITGYVAIAGSLLSFFFSPMLGALSDAYGRKVVLLATELITLTTYGLLVMHSWFGWSLWPYICMSCTTAAFSPLSFAFAYASDITAPAERAVAFALLMASLEVSMIVGQRNEQFSERRAQPTVLGS
jgi:MFS family permease